MNRSEPYIGITGLTTVAEAKAVADIFASVARNVGPGSEKCLPGHHQPAFGFCINEQMIAGYARPNRRYVRMSELAGALQATHTYGINVFHHVIEEPTPEHVVAPLRVLFEMDDIYANNLCRVVQLNNKAVGVEVVAELRGLFPELKIIYQLQRDLLNSRSHGEVVDFLLPYVPLIDYILVDRSAGEGLPFDPVEAAVLLKQLRMAYPSLGLGVTGGFSPENVGDRLRYLNGELGGDFSLDVETHVRRKLSGEKWDDELDMRKVQAFLECAYGAFIEGHD